MREIYAPAAIGWLAVVSLSVFSFTVDFSPVALGNTWVYRRAVPGVMWFPPHDYLRTISIIRVTKSGPDSSTLTFNAAYSDDGGTSSDTVFSIVKTPDSIKGAGNLSLYFKYSKIDTALLTGHYFLRNDTVVYARGGRSSSPFGDSFDTSAYMDNVGLVYHFTQSNFRESYYQDGDELMSFKPGDSPTGISRGIEIISGADEGRNQTNHLAVSGRLIITCRGSGAVKIPPYATGIEVYDVKGVRLYKNECCSGTVLYLPSPITKGGVCFVIYLK